MKMYIANGTHQNIDFQYRLPEVKNWRQQNIAIGGQIKISGDLSQKDIDLIIEHHSIYGMVPAKDLHKFKGFFIPYVYSVEDPISAELMTELVIQNREYNRAMGVKQRLEAAVTVSSEIENQMPPNVNYLKNFEMTVEELPSKDRDAEINEGVRVTRNPEKGAPQGPTENPIDLQAHRRKSMF